MTDYASIPRFLGAIPADIAESCATTPADEHESVLTSIAEISEQTRAVGG